MAADAVWPEGYLMTADGLFETKDGKLGRKVADTFQVLGQARDTESSDWGLALAWKDADGVEHTKILPNAALLSRRSEVLAPLAAAGLRVAQPLKLIDALGGVITTDRVRLVDQTGWHGDAFVLPDRVIGPLTEQLHLRAGPRAHRFAQSGTLDDWKRQVAAKASGNPLLLVAQALAFSGPVFSLLEERPIGIHLRGGSSSGKSTALLAAGSVWGGGGPSGFVESWRATDNALEGQAAGHNSTVLILDELAEIDSQVAAKAVYALLNGKGKARADREGDTRARKEWLTPLLSSGELSLEDKIAEAGRGLARSGLDARLIDVFADSGAHRAFDELHGHPDGGAFARSLGEAARSVYGTAGPAFVEQIAADPGLVLDALRDLAAHAVATLSVGVTDSLQLRVAHALAIVAASGDMAREVLELPWREGEVLNATKAIFDQWREHRGSGESEVEKALILLRDTIERDEARFWSISGNEGQVVRDALGIRGEIGGEDCFGIYGEAFKNCVRKAGDPQHIARALRDRGYLVHDDGRLTRQVRARDDTNRRDRVYAVRVSMLFPGDAGDS